jgi:fructokinase
MKSVICFGEALIDFLNIGQHQDQPLMLNEFRQYPGGAPANAAVAIAKLGGKSLFAGQVGQDAFGDFLKQALINYQVDVSLVSQHPSAKTALAFVMLDEQGERSFSFYRDQTADVLFKPDQVSAEWFSANSIFHFCSNTLTDQHIAQTTQYAISCALEKKALVSFDVNLRHNLWGQGRADIARVNKFARQADILKYSLDELHYLADGNTHEYIRELIDNGVSLILVTDGAKTIKFYSAMEQGEVTPPSVTAVDTTAGGDAFIGGFLFGLSIQADPIALLSQSQPLVQLIEFASACGAYAVNKQGAFPALPRLQDLPENYVNKLGKIK